ncbi:MAG: aldolase/citrate lyase family protein [Rhodospirillales bacterium]
MIKENRVKKALKENRKCCGIRLTVPSPGLVEMMGMVDLDFVFLDVEHGVFDTTVIEDVCRTADLYDITPIARVPDITPGTINRILDRGVRGVIAPHIANKKDAQDIVNACYFGPLGERSYGGGRSSNYQVNIDDLPAYLQATNEQMCIGAMIETKEGADKVEELLEVEGIDFFMFGPADFAQDMGYPGQLKHPEVMKAVEATTAKIHAAGRKMREDFMIQKNLSGILIGAARDMVKQRDA